MTAYRFDLPKDIFHRPNNSKDDCFTLPGDDPLPSGVADISPCYYNFPFGISLPHFYGATDDLMKYLKVKGMKADEKKHGSYVIIEPVRHKFIFSSPIYICINKFFLFSRRLESRWKAVLEVNVILLLNQCPVIRIFYKNLAIR